MNRNKKGSESQLNCPHCGRIFTVEDAIFCPYCSKPINQKFIRTGKPIASGILLIISACLSLLVGIPSILIIASYPSIYFPSLYVTFWIIIGLWSILSFGFGLAGGIYSLKRTHFGLSLIGSSFLVATGVMTLISLFISYFTTSFGFIGVPLLILAILGTIFVAISKNEFI